MNQKHYTLWTALITSAFAFLFLCNCQGSEEELAQEHIVTDATESDAQAFDVPTTHVNETIIETLPESTPAPVVATAASVAPAASIAPVAPELVPPDPLLFYQEPFADDIKVAPWHANYVGSYGLLPTRFQDKGPFLYSFDVSPEAAESEDNNLGPLEFFDFGGDDDDDH